MTYLKRNQDIRKAKGTIPNWLIAEKLGIHENSIYRMLRQELTNDKKKEILAIIQVIKSERDM